MRATKLILLEGAPGSGKSTLAQTLLRHLHHQGIAATWWYEEDVHHPLYIFHDEVSLRQVLDDLSGGHYRRVVAQALAKWQRFADDLRDAEGVVLLDSCLFGYLTWSLFPLAWIIHDGCVGGDHPSWERRLPAGRPPRPARSPLAGTRPSTGAGWKPALPGASSRE